MAVNVNTVRESTAIWVGCPDQIVSHLIDNQLLTKMM